MIFTSLINLLHFVHIRTSNRINFDLCSIPVVKCLQTSQRTRQFSLSAITSSQLTPIFYKSILIGVQIITINNGTPPAVLTVTLHSERRKWKAQTSTSAHDDRADYAHQITGTSYLPMSLHFN